MFQVATDLDAAKDTDFFASHRATGVLVECCIHDMMQVCKAIGEIAEDW